MKSQFFSLLSTSACGIHRETHATLDTQRLDQRFKLRSLLPAPSASMCGGKSSIGSFAR
jgi:hypothetical protein